MIKIGIITFHRANNFGAVLQAYALCTFLNKQKDLQAEIIDYRSETIERRNLQLPFGKYAPKETKKKIKALLSYKSIILSRKAFDEFRKNELMTSRPVDKQGLKKLALNYDILICGSDQIWNLDITQHDFSFFLDFANPRNKVFSYAASVGNANHIIGNESTFVEQLSRFKQISVREKETREMLEKILRKEVRQDIDPVFLLSCEEWREIEERQIKKPYILVFKMGSDKSGDWMFDFAKETGRKRSLKIIYLSDNERWYQHREVTHIGSVSIKQFLGLIHGAEMVVTNSFHATAFSVIFNTPFYVETSMQRAERIVNMLNMFSIPNRALYRGSLQGTDSSIPWDTVNNQANREIEKSKKYIFEMVKQVEKQEEDI